MKICILTTSFPRFQGDHAGTFVYDLAAQLVDKGLEIEVVAPHQAGLPTQELMGKVKVRRFSYMFPTRWQKVAYGGGIPANLSNFRMAWFQLPFFLVGFFLTGIRVCRDCDIIHAYWIFSGFVATLLSAVYSKPIVLTVQGSDVNVLFHNPVLRRFRSFVINRVSKIIAVSTPLAERVRMLGAAAKNVVLIPNGVDTAAFQQGVNNERFGYRLLWVGRLVSVKGLDFLVRAMLDVVSVFPEANLTLVGDGPLHADVNRTIAELGLEANIRLTGLVSHEQIPAYLAECDLFVLPSLSEGLPLVLVEAMSAGKPVVASKVGGIPDVIVDSGDRKTGYMVPPADSEALAQAIITMLSDSQQARTMGENGRTYIEKHYAWSIIAKETVALYRSLL
jgi:glycosyltransferase involved in cell wall biosynthesis